MGAIADTTCPQPHGRDAELAELAAVLDDAKRGSSGALLLCGEAGAGKSALLDHVTKAADGFVVLRTSGVEAESEFRYAGLRRLFGAQHHRLSRLPDPQRRALSVALGIGEGRADDRFLIYTAVLGLLSEICAGEQLLVCIDDLQWLDEPSAAALAFAARRLADTPGRGPMSGAALVAASRLDGSTEAASRAIPVCALRGLDPAGCIAVLIGHGSGPVTPAVAADLALGTGGNPLALTELVGTLSADQFAGRVPLPDPLPVGEQIVAAYGAALPGLPDETRQLLVLVAVEESGGHSLLAAAAREAGLEIDELDPAESARVVVIGPAGVRFRHPLMRSVVYHGATPGARRAAHRAISAALARPEDADQRAWHRAASILVPTESVAADLANTAGMARARGGHPAGLRALERAARLTPAPLGKATRFTAAAEDALAAGRAGHALWLLDHAARAGPEDQLNGRITRLRGEVELRGGVVAHAYDTLVAAATRLSATAPAEALQSLAAAGEAAGYAGDAAKVVALGGLARSIESPAERDEDRILRDILWGGSELFGGRVAEGMTLLNSAISAWESAACPQDDPRLLARLALAATLAGADVKAHTIAHVAVEAATRMGAVAVVPHALEYLVASEVFRGAYESAQSHAVQGIGIAETTGQVNSGCHLRANLALVAAFRGDERVCRSQSALAMRQATAHGLGLPAAVASWALGMIDLAANRTAAASQRLLDLSSAGPGAGHPVIAMLSIPHLVEALVRHDPSDVSVARAAASVFGAWAEQTGQPWALALSSRCAALLATEAEVDGHFRRALELHGRSGRPFDRARTEMQYGELLRRNRSRAQARVRLRSAWETFDRLGSGLWERRALAELRATGETVGLARSASATATLLTSQELRIARMVAAGATNRQVAAELFLSPRTVDYHLRKVFRRLGVTSRVELAHVDELR